VVDTFEALGAAVADVDNDILHLKRRRAALMRRRNALLPVSRLPAELLAYIFELTSTQAIPFMMASYVRNWWPQAPNPFVVLSLSHVSWAFRGLAIRTPALWIAPRFVEPLGGRSPVPFVDVTLARAARVPLCIVDELPTSENFISRSHVGPVRHLWTNLDQHLCTHVDWDSLTSRLETMHIGLSGCEAPLDELAIVAPRLLALSVGDAARLPPQFSIRAPALTRIAWELMDCVPHEMLHGITLLEKLPSLAEVVISIWPEEDEWNDMTMEDIMQPAGIRARSLHLPALRSVRLIGNLKACVFAIRLLEDALQAPRPLDISIEESVPGITGTLDQFQEGEVLECYVRRHLSSANRAPIRVNFSGLPGDLFTRCSFEGLSADGTDSLRLIVECRLGFTLSDGTLGESLLDGLDFRKLRYLRISGVQQDAFLASYPPWDQLRSAPLLEVIHVETYSPYDEEIAAFLNALSPLPSETTIPFPPLPSEITIPFPALRSLELSADRQQAHHFNHLAEVLGMRAECDSRLDTLRITIKCGGWFSKDYSELRRVLSGWVTDTQVKVHHTADGE
jgi:hypothetical protein